MSSTVRWHRATEMFDGEPAWNAVKERERKDVFDDVTFLLAKKEKEREKELRVENRAFMTRVFNSMTDVTYRTTWLEVSNSFVSTFISTVLIVLINQCLPNERNLSTQFQNHRQWYEKLGSY